MIDKNHPSYFTFPNLQTVLGVAAFVAITGFTCYQKATSPEILQKQDVYGTLDLDAEIHRGRVDASLSFEKGKNQVELSYNPITNEYMIHKRNDIPAIRNLSDSALVEIVRESIDQ